MIAVTGASGLVGTSLLRVLGDDPAVTRIVAIDVREPSRRARNLEFHRADIARSELEPLLRGCELLVHLAAVVDPVPDEALMARVNVDGTRRVLAAAAAVGVRKVVRVSPATVYGAWPNNPVPLTEDAPLRPNATFTPAVHAAEVERLLAEWRDEHPDAVVTTLRSAPVLGPGAERLPSRVLLGRPPLAVRGASPPVQAVHLDDLVAALAHVVRHDHPGVFNVAADGWIDGAEARARLPRQPIGLPAEALERALDLAWRTGLSDVPPGVVPYLMHPWVVANDRLRATGWTPRHTNEEAIAAGLAALGPPPSRARVWLLAAGSVVGAVVLGRAARRTLRRRRDARRARRPTRR